MATDSRALPAYFSSSTDFQNWCQGIHAQLANCGLVNTSDTGQINNATVSAPSAASTSQGYEIWRFNDTLQSTTPVYLKLEYGSGAASTTPSLWLTTGTGTNGAGTLTGAVMTRRQIPVATGSSSGVTLTSYCSGDGSRIALCTNYNPSAVGSAMLMIVDRSRDGANNTTSDAICQFTGAASSPFQSIQLIYGSNVSSAISGNIFGLQPGVESANGVYGGGVASVGANVVLMPWFVIVGQLRYMLAGAHYVASTISALTQISVSTLGGTHTYITLPSLSNYGQSSNSDAFAMIWE